MNGSTISFMRMIAFAGPLATAGIAGAQLPNSSPGTRSCSDQTLTGDYGAKIEGTLLGPNWSLRTLVLFRFNGHRGFAQSSYVVLNGSPVSPDWPQSTGTRPVEGRYQVNPDCTGSAAIDDETHSIRFHFVIVNQGRLLYLVTDGDAIAGEARKVD